MNSWGPISVVFYHLGTHFSISLHCVMKDLKVDRAAELLNRKLQTLNP